MMVRPGRTGAVAKRSWRDIKREWWPDPASARLMWQQLVFSRVALLAVGWIALTRFPWKYVSPTYNVTTNPLVVMWVRWDALWYIDIAHHGYWFQALAFFPLYPLLIAAVHTITTLPAYLAGLVISNLALIGATAALWGLVREYYPRGLADRSVSWFLMFPTAFYLSAVYTESLFLFMTLMAFWMAKRGRLPLAALFGLLAGLTRSQGIITILPIFLAYVERYGQTDRAPWLGRWGWPKGRGWAGWNDHTATDGTRSGWTWRRWQILWVAVPLGGLMAYMGWQWAVFHTPMAFVIAQSFWGRHIAWPWVGIMTAISNIWAGSPLQPDAVLSMIDLVFALAFIGFWVLGFMQRLPRSWLVFWAALLLVDIMAPDVRGRSPLMSMSRLVLVLFPVFVSLGMLSERPEWDRFLRWLFPMLQAVFFAIFATWHWIA